MGASPCMFLVCVCILYVMLFTAAACAAVPPVSGCKEFYVPAQTAWTSSYLKPYTSEINPTWSVNAFDPTQVSVSSESCILRCGYNTSANFTNVTACGCIQSDGSVLLGPFLMITIDLEWYNVTRPQYEPAVIFQKKKSSAWYDDSFAVALRPVNATTAVAHAYWAGPYPATGNSGYKPIRIAPGRHNFTILWDNSTIIMFLDSVNAVSVTRYNSTSYFPSKPGIFNVQLNYDETTGTPMDIPSTTGPNTAYTVYSIDMKCISPVASNCLTETNPLPGLAYCDFVTASWIVSGDVQLNSTAPVQTTTAPSTTTTTTTTTTTVSQDPSATTDPSSTTITQAQTSTTSPDTSSAMTPTPAPAPAPPPPLNLTGTSLQINGTLELSSGGLVVGGGSVLNVTGITFRGNLTVDISSLNLSKSGVNIVLVNYQNFTGNFSNVQLVGAAPLRAECQQYTATPMYGQDRLSVLVKVDSSQCKKKHKVPIGIIVGGIVGGILLIAVVVGVVMLLFCQESAMFRKQPKRKMSGISMLSPSAPIDSH